MHYIYIIVIKIKKKKKINPGLYKVAWAHPEFGSLIAVACDRSVLIFEETSYGQGKNTQNGWVKRSPPLSDARDSITDLKVFVYSYNRTNY